MPDSQDGHMTGPPTAQAPNAVFPPPPPPKPRRSPFVNESKKWAKRYRTEISATSASFAGTFFTFPLDYLKTRMQETKGFTLHDIIRLTYRNEGLAGFVRGVTAPLASIALVRTVSFSIYQRAKYKYDDWIYKFAGVSPLVQANAPNTYPSLATIACFGGAGATSGALCTAISCPFELAKTVTQITQDLGPENDNGKTKTGVKGSGKTSHKHLTGSWQAAKKIVSERGLWGLYAGWRVHLVRDVFGTAIYFMTYESSKQILANARGHSPASPLPVVIAGGICGMVSWAAIYPFDTARVAYQKAYFLEGKDAARAVRLMDFTKTAYRGLVVSMVRSGAVNAIFFSVFEFTKKRINNLEVET